MKNTTLLPIVFLLLGIFGASALYLTKCQTKALIESSGYWSSDDVRKLVRPSSNSQELTRFLPLSPTADLHRL
jgi:hypothetical protein